MKPAARWRKTFDNCLLGLPATWTVAFFGLTAMMFPVDLPPRDYESQIAEIVKARTSPGIWLMPTGIEGVEKLAHLSPTGTTA